MRAISYAMQILRIMSWNWVGALVYPILLALYLLFGNQSGAWMIVVNHPVLSAFGALLAAVLIVASVFSFFYFSGNIKDMKVSVGLLLHGSMAIFDIALFYLVVFIYQIICHVSIVLH